MQMVYITIIASSVPLILLLWAIMDVSKGKTEKLRWKWPLASLILLVGISFIVNIYFMIRYGLPLFPAWKDIQIGAIVIASITLLIGLIFGIVHLSVRNKNLPKSVHNPKALGVIIAVLIFQFSLGFFWFYPTGEKFVYVKALDRAAETFAEEQEQKEVSLELVHSERQCIQRTTCYNSTPIFHNLFIVKNNMDKKAEIQLNIRALNEDEKELKVIESIVVTLEAGEYKALKTNETDMETSPWKRWTFETNERVEYFQFKYRFREPG